VKSKTTFGFSQQHPLRSDNQFRIGSPLSKGIGGVTEDGIRIDLLGSVPDNLGGALGSSGDVNRLAPEGLPGREENVRVCADRLPANRIIPANVELAWPYNKVATLSDDHLVVCHERILLFGLGFRPLPLNRIET
jgi:hypothetical protein